MSQEMNNCVFCKIANGEIPVKFIQVLETIVKGGLKKSVVYSNFWEKGCLLFAKYLDSMSVKYEFITPTTSDDESIRILKDFEDEKCPILILHPEKTEGVSIRGAAQLHILEPLLSYARQQQLVARVNRYESHTHLPLNERKVDVYFWCASVEGYLQWLRKHFSTVKHWFLNEINMTYGNRTLDFTQDGTPDFLVMENNKELYTLMQTLKENSNEISDSISSRTKDKEKCCIWEPNEKHVKNCLSKHGKMCVS
jgi:hypothetical protein